MNANEFVQWIAIVGQQLPELLQPLITKPQLSAQWSDDLSTYTLEQCTSKIEQMRTDRSLWPKDNDRDFLGLYVAKAIDLDLNAEARKMQRELQTRDFVAARSASGVWSCDQPVQYANHAKALAKLCAERRRLKEEGLNRRQIDEITHQLCTDIFDREEPNNGAHRT